MENMEEIKSHFGFTVNDQKNLQSLGGMLLPMKEQFADDFYGYLRQHPDTAKYFTTQEAVARRKETFCTWFEEMLTSTYDNSFLRRLQRVGKRHVDIGLKSYHVNAAMNYIRELCRHHTNARVLDGCCQEEVLDSMHKALDINLSILTSSFQEEKMKKVFLSQSLENRLVNWAERLLHGLNLILLVGLLVMAVGVVVLLGVDIVSAFSGKLDYGVIRALGSLLILWMFIELLHTEIEHLQGGKFHVRIFIEVALVAFIRKLFVASFKSQDPVSFGLLLVSLLVLGVVYFMVAKIEKNRDT
jgi:uncharacterized membrane protein (DUF373 family)/truncated hemoglobin YjbI